MLGLKLNHVSKRGQLCLVVPHRDQPSGAPTAAFDSWANSLLIGLQTRLGDAQGCKCNILIREYSPKAMTIFGVTTAHQ